MMAPAPNAVRSALTSWVNDGRGPLLARLTQRTVRGATFSRIEHTIARTDPPRLPDCVFSLVSAIDIYAEGALVSQRHDDVADHSLATLRAISAKLASSPPNDPISAASAAELGAALLFREHAQQEGAVPLTEALRRVASYADAAFAGLTLARPLPVRMDGSVRMLTAAHTSTPHSPLSSSVRIAQPPGHHQDAGSTSPSTGIGAVLGGLAAVCAFEEIACAPERTTWVVRAVLDRVIDRWADALSVRTQERERPLVAARAAVAHAAAVGAGTARAMESATTAHAAGLRPAASLVGPARDLDEARKGYVEAQSALMKLESAHRRRRNNWRLLEGGDASTSAGNEPKGAA